MSSVPHRKPLVFLLGNPIKTPPMGELCRRMAGQMLSRIQRGEMILFPLSRPMPSIGSRVHELRLDDRSTSWRIIYRIDASAIVVVSLFEKRGRKTTKREITLARRRLRDFDRITPGD
jgi:phage-related protein